MNKTTNYQLNQWERTDKVRMEDFNADNAKIDAALGALASGKADASALAALAARVTAVEPLARDHTVTGSFEGNDTAGRVIPLSWTPKLVILMGYVSGRTCLGLLTADCFTNCTGIEPIIYYEGYGDYPFFPGIQENGILLKSSHFNTKGKTTYYVAFR